MNSLHAVNDYNKAGSFGFLKIDIIHILSVY